VHLYTLVLMVSFQDNLGTRMSN